MIRVVGSEPALNARGEGCWVQFDHGARRDRVILRLRHACPAAKHRSGLRCRRQSRIDIIYSICYRIEPFRPEGRCCSWGDDVLD